MIYSLDVPHWAAFRQEKLENRRAIQVILVVQLYGTFIPLLSLLARSFQA
jgi:hypothetical protein